MDVCVDSVLPTYFCRTSAAPASNITSGCLLYADNVKKIRKITSPDDGLLLQNDLDQLSAWSVKWGRTLNPKKCRSFTMTLRRAPVQTKYIIAGVALEHESEIRDLGVTLETNLTLGASTCLT